MTDQGAIDSPVAETISTYGAVNILFNNAGFGAGGQFPDETVESWNTVLDANLTGTFRMSKAVWPHLIEAGGGGDR